MSRWARSALTSIGTTALDFIVLVALVELAGVDYRIATLAGTVAGASSNFWINRRWAFAATAGRAHLQLVRFVPVQLGSSLLHTLGVWGVTAAGVPYLASKIAVAAAVYVGWNDPMNRAFVFSRERSAGALRRRV